MREEEDCQYAKGDSDSTLNEEDKGPSIVAARVYSGQSSREEATEGSREWRSTVE